jgi:hypothetical protein
MKNHGFSKEKKRLFLGKIWIFLGKLWNKLGFNWEQMVGYWDIAREMVGKVGIWAANIEISSPNMMINMNSWWEHL